MCWVNKQTLYTIALSLCQLNLYFNVWLSVDIREQNYIHNNFY